MIELIEAVAARSQPEPTAPAPDFRTEAVLPVTRSFEQALRAVGGRPADGTTPAGRTPYVGTTSVPVGRSADPSHRILVDTPEVIAFAASPVRPPTLPSSTAAATTLGEQLATAAAEYVGLPARSGANGPTEGFGAAAFVDHALARIGASLGGADPSDVGRAVAALGDARPGDVIVSDGGQPGIYLGDSRMMAADETAGLVRTIVLDGAPAAIRRIVRTDAAALQRGEAIQTADVVDPTLLAGRATAGRFPGLEGVPYADLFVKEGTEHGVDPRLLAAVAWQESRFTPTAVSHAGAQGLMQLMPATARGLGVADSFDPTQAVDGAARLLAGHLKKYGGSARLALAAYNAGGGAVDRHGGVPPYKETQHYVVVVQQKYEELRS